MFVKGDEKLTRLVPRTDIHQVLQQVAQSLAKLPSPNLLPTLPEQPRSERRAQNRVVALFKDKARPRLPRLTR